MMMLIIAPILCKLYAYKFYYEKVTGYALNMLKVNMIVLQTYQ